MSGDEPTASREPERATARAADAARANGGRVGPHQAPGVAAPSAEGEPGTSPYEFVIDLESDNTHASVVRMVGRSRRVLELGPASGYMSRVLQERGCAVVAIELDADLAATASQYCERVIVGDVEAVDLDAELGEDRFDVILAADVLEHLKDPLGTLVQLRRFLAPDGAFVVSLPNVAHASVRLSLLQGQFNYRDLGLLDRTHLRFFTHDTITKLFDDAELAIVEMHRQDAPFAIADAPADLDRVPSELIGELQQDPDARTYQFVIKAVPVELPGLRALQARLHELALARDEAARELELLRGRLSHVEPRVGELEEALAAISGREGSLRAALVQAHDDVLRRDEDIERLRGELVEQAELLAESELRIVELERHLVAQRENEAVQLSARDEHIRRLRARLERILGSPPAKAYAALGRLPLLRRVVARRTAGYERLRDSGSSDA